MAEAGTVGVLITKLAAEQPPTSVLATDDTFRAAYEAQMAPVYPSPVASVL